MSKNIVCVFNNYENAENATLKIKDRGYKTADISIVGRHNSNSATDDNSANATMLNNSSVDNVSDGAITGGVLGGLAGLLLGVGTMAIPGLGIIAAAGPITGLLSGAITGGVVGSLVDLGIPDDQSKQYESHIQKGNVLFSMKCDEDTVDTVTDILKQNGADNINVY